MKKMVRALVLSDTHGNKGVIDRALRQFADFDYIFHLGDNISDARYIEQNTRAIVVAVKGNCDMGDAGNDTEQVVLCGQKIILTHGHLLKVKYSYDRAFYYAQEQGAKAILFGHTHQPYCKYEDGIWLVNPGSAGCSYDGIERAATLMIGEVGVIPKLRIID